MDSAPYRARIWEAMISVTCVDHMTHTHTVIVYMEQSRWLVERTLQRRSTNANSEYFLMDINSPHICFQHHNFIIDICNYILLIFIGRSDGDMIHLLRTELNCGSRTTRKMENNNIEIKYARIRSSSRHTHTRTRAKVVFHTVHALYEQLENDNFSSRCTGLRLCMIAGTMSVPSCASCVEVHVPWLFDFK